MDEKGGGGALTLSWPVVGTERSYRGLSKEEAAGASATRLKVQISINFVSNQ